MTNPPFSVVVVATDAAARVSLALAAQSIPGANAVVVDDLAECVAAVEQHRPLVVLGDITVVSDGSDRIEAMRASSHGVAFVLVAERPSLSDAVLALRARVEEFLSGPADDDAVRDAVRRVADASRERRRERSGRAVLALGATLESVVLGAGGTLRAHARAGDEVIVAVAAPPAGADARRRVAEVLGLAVEVLDLPADATDDETLHRVQMLVDRSRPRIVYTHAADDASALHRRLHRVTTEVCVAAERVSSYQSLESSIDFAPTVFVDVDDALEAKIQALEAVGTSLPGDGTIADRVRSLATYWSRFGGGRSCEPFEVVRDHVVASTHAARERVPAAPLASRAPA